MRHLELKIGVRLADRERARKASRRALAPTFAKHTHKGGLERILGRVAEARRLQA